jgi:hypothetical protein
MSPVAAADNKVGRNRMHPFAIVRFSPEKYRERESREQAFASDRKLTYLAFASSSCRQVGRPPFSPSTAARWPDWIIRRPFFCALQCVCCAVTTVFTQLPVSVWRQRRRGSCRPARSLSPRCGRLFPLLSRTPGYKRPDSRCRRP